jgi:hypothetical protein
MPELLDDDNGENDEASSAISGHARQSNRRGNFFLEPAFLSDAEYPAGWIIYHPVLGVVARAAAERYELERRRIIGTPEEERKVVAVLPVAKRQNDKSDNGSSSLGYPNGTTTVYAEDVSRDTPATPAARQSQSSTVGAVPILRSIAASG